MGKRIAVVSEHASPLAAAGGVDSGGQNVYVAQTARHLARLGHEVVVFTRRERDDQPIRLRWLDGVEVVNVPAGPPVKLPKERLLPHMREFAEFMKDFVRGGERFDLVHANFWMSGLVACRLKRELGLPFVVTFHALGKVRRLHQGDADGFPIERLEIERRTMLDADRIIAECPQDRDDQRILYGAPSGKIRLVPCGFDPVEFRPIPKSVARETLGLPKDEFLILQLGRMVPRKGVDDAIRGLARSLRRGGSGRLLVVGGESETPDPAITPEIGRLRRVACEEGIESRVTFVGQRGRDALRHYYSAADVFVTTPWYEPFGITPLEAMACATPVVGANVGGIKYTVVDGATGWLVPPRDPNAIADRLLRLEQRPEERARMGRKAVDHANTHFTWKRVTESLATVYEETLASLAPAAPALPAVNVEAASHAS